MKNKNKNTIFLILTILSIIFLSILFYSMEADFIICTVNDTPITYIQFMRELNRYKIAIKAQGKSIPENVKEIVLNNLIEINLIIQEAKINGIDVSDEEVKLNIESIKKRYGMNDEQFVSQLQMEGFSYNEFVNNYKNQMIRYKFINTIIKKMVKMPTEEEIEKFYKDNKEKFKGSKKYNAIVFFTDLAIDSKLFDRLEAKKMLIKFHDKINKNNYKNVLENFNKTNKIKIKMYSKIIYPEIEDPDFVKILNDEIVDSKTKVFFYNKDYYFFLIKSLENIEYIPLQDIKEKIINYIEQTKIEKAFKSWIEKKKKEAVINWYRKDIIYVVSTNKTNN